MSRLPPVSDMSKFDFHVEGHGMRVACSVVEARDERGAFRAALRQCKRFELPGWMLVCDTTGNSIPVVELLDYSQPGKPRKERA